MWALNQYGIVEPNLTWGRNLIEIKFVENMTQTPFDYSHPVCMGALICIQGVLKPTMMVSMIFIFNVSWPSSVHDWQDDVPKIRSRVPISKDALYVVLELTPLWKPLDVSDEPWRFSDESTQKTNLFVGLSNRCHKAASTLIPHKNWPFDTPSSVVNFTAI